MYGKGNNMKRELADWVTKAKNGDKKALEQVILSIKDLVYNLSLKILLYPEDAQDAAQEILIKIITHLSTFRNESHFETWVYRIASNYLLTTKGKRAKEFAMSFEDYAVLIDTGQSDVVSYTENEGELKLLEEEVKMSCTRGLLQCLDERARMVYILGDLLGLNSRVGGVILNVSASNFRQLLSRSRNKVRNFLEAKCGLANPSNPCRCRRKIDFLIREEVIEPERLRFAPLSQRSIDLIDQIEGLEKTLAIYRSAPEFPAPKELVVKVRELLALT